MVRPGGLGRVEPTDWKHVDRYPLTADIVREITEPQPMVMGVNWYEEFDRPKKYNDGWWVARDGRLTNVRGGHCVAIRPKGEQIPESWQDWYNQVSEGICVGEGICFMMSFFNRERYQPRWLYDRCKERDGYPGDGTWVSVGLDVAKELGLVKAKRGEDHWLTSTQVDPERVAKPEKGISTYRWATNVDDILNVTGSADKGYISFTNSWGDGYPKVVRMPAEVVDRLLREHGEFGIVTDR